ncbi:polyisoprenoid-binding protein [Rhodoferax lacus]|uniref:Polyisoprenoid-binding protein n=1 Tax=Rhodoferax lacus TaxID=2184758 RepID=A0A3E1RHF6_9BURK|nr:YceI family protein [Rhodoferax lacus]RFO98788.1 polyisoprenoid-binding protein [Rhodoferax lacus]
MKLYSSLSLLALTAAALTFSGSALAQQKLVAAQSDISFVTKQMGVPLDGHFKKFDAQISFDTAKPEAAKIAFTVDTGSATLGAPESDAEMPKAPWFNVPKFPQATFQSSGVKSLGGGKFQVTGKLTIKGNTKDVDVPVALTQANGITTAVGQFPIKRLAFKIGEGEWADTSMVADDVQVRFKLSISGMGKL